MILTKGQIKCLRAEAHRLKLKPVIIIGQKGLSENLQSEIELALAHHELLKIRIPGMEKADKKELADLLCSRHNATLIELIGNVIVIYRPNIESNRYGKCVDT